MNEDNNERKKNELMAIESIYSERNFVRSSEAFGGQLSAYVEIPAGLKVLYSTSDASNNPLEESLVKLDIKHFPAILLNFELPDSYPTLSPPLYTLSCKWLNLSQLSKICEVLDKCWTIEDGLEVLYTWMQVLTNDVWKIINVSNELILSVSTLDLRLKSDDRVFQETDSLSNLVTYLIDYNSKEVQHAFDNAYFECVICDTEKPGFKCCMFSKCKHVFCGQCISEYFSVQIRDGSVRALSCPQEKCESQADPNLVKMLVSRGLYEKYENFLLQSTFGCMDEITYCPRKTCNSVVLKESNMGQCPVCHFVFCVLCKRTYHGVASCPVNDKELVKLYLNCSVESRQLYLSCSAESRQLYLNGSAEEKENLKKRYGKKQLEQAVDEHFSEIWLENNSKRCPRCSTSIEKIDGCNKMRCYKCGKNFCWLCGKELTTANPYKHFNIPKSKCYNRLSEGLDVNRFEEFAINDDGDDNLN